MYGECFKMKKAEIWSHGFGNERIGQSARKILDARGLYPDSSPADLYDEMVSAIDDGV